ncbi:capsule assembly Wzi family protein [Hymenobacter koreensis]|uniref:Capsule assembly Wzi family protein n=1 Tax=Hymenobacter koreensis TaxID=1084523 RepID=A0ABP8IX84_9BACT
MTHRFLCLLLTAAGFAAPAAPLLAQQTDTTRVLTPVPAPVQVPAQIPVQQPVTPAPAPVSAAPRIDVTEPRRTIQAPVYVPLDQDIYRLIDRYAIKFGPDSIGDIHTSNRPYNRAAVARLAERMMRESSSRDFSNLSKADQFNISNLQIDNWPYISSQQNPRETNVFRAFGRYFNPKKNPGYVSADLYSVQTPDFTLRVNPVVHFQLGSDTETSDGLRFVNTRGVQVEGTIDQRLGFYTYLADNQMAVPLYVQRRVQRDTIVPHEAYWKYYKQDLTDPNPPSKYDFLSARGYLTYAATKHINVQLGHDRNFIGNGYRSLILSDYAAPYFFLKLNTRIWKFNYQNLFAEMNADRGVQDRVDPKKYMVLHHLSLDITPSLNVGVFESTILARRKGRFELQYLNPIIFYRAVEQAIGSDDNALLGLDFKWNVLKRGQLYGQVVLDEFVLSQIRSGNGWWANKQAFQLGGRYIDVFGLRNLDAQLEFNYIRPYTYQHIDYYTGYTHYQQPLAHPMGANLREVLGVLSYQPLPRLSLVGKAFYVQQGLDNVNELGVETNYGGNVLKPYTNRVQDFGNSVGQGVRYNLLHGDFTATFQARHNLFLDAKLIVRNSNLFGNEAIPSISLRWNAVQRLHEF